MPHLEIERVFLLDGVPDMPATAVRLRIEQGYLPPAGAGEDDVEGRVRRVTDDTGTVTCFHTVKRGLGRVREEIERRLSREDFARLWLRTAPYRVHKTRYRVAEDDLVWEIDVFDDLDLVLAEVELETEDRAVTPPPWLSPRVRGEVTEDARYRNFNLARCIAGEAAPPG